MKGKQFPRNFPSVKKIYFNIKLSRHLCPADLATFDIVLLKCRCQAREPSLEPGFADFEKKQDLLSLWGSNV